jgi:hypothetical protein
MGKIKLEFFLRHALIAFPASLPPATSLCHYCVSIFCRLVAASNRRRLRKIARKDTPNVSTTKCGMCQQFTAAKRVLKLLLPMGQHRTTRARGRGGKRRKKKKANMLREEKKRK